MRRLWAGISVGSLTLALAGYGGRAVAQDSHPAPARPADAAVSGVVVTAQRQHNQVLIDRRVYTVTGNLQATTGSAADVLNDVPSVNVNVDGGITLRGDPHVTILVDGKPSAAFSGAAAGLSLLQMPASEIDRVEVMANPPAQYKAEGAGGVINIVTRKNRRPGFSGTIRLNGGTEGRYVLGADAAYRAGPLSLSAGAGLRRDIRRRLTTDVRSEIDPATGIADFSTESIDEHFDRLTPSAKVGFDYQLNPAQSFGGSGDLTVLTGHRVFDQADVGGPPGSPPLSSRTRHSDGHEQHIEDSQEAHASQRLWRPDETLSLSFRRSATIEHEHYDYRNAFAAPPAPDSSDDLRLGLDLTKLELAIDYDLPLANHGDLKLGYDLEADSDLFDNRGDLVDPVTGRSAVDPAVTNRFRYRQTVHAFYAAYSRPVGPWTLQAGLRAEATHVAWLQVESVIPGERREFAVYPNLQIERTLGRADKVSFAVSRRVTRPDPESLNPFSDHQDVFNLRAGNPNLLPQETWSAQLTYAHGAGSLSYGADAYYRLDRNAVTDVARPLGGGVVLLTKANLPRSQSVGLEFNAGGRLPHGLSYSLSGEAFYSQIDAAALGAPGLKSTVGLNLKASLEYRPTAADTLQVSLSRTARRLTPQGFVDAISLVNLGYRRQLRPDLALVATLSDLLNGQRFRRLVTSPTLQDAYQRYQVGRIAYLGLVYTFGGPGRGRPSDFDYAQ